MGAEYEYVVLCLEGSSPNVFVKATEDLNAKAGRLSRLTLTSASPLTRMVHSSRSTLT